MTTRAVLLSYTPATGNERPQQCWLPLPRRDAALHRWRQTLIRGDAFHKFASKSAEAVGSAKSFLAALLLIVVWTTAGPYFGWSDGHHLLDGVLIQHTQDRDTRALHLKIDELLKATRGARNSMIDLDHLSDQQLMQLEAEFKRICSSNVESATDADP